ncbi:site-2 protease family protein [Candidatus Gracilibacteria bacterium]|nr:site-2 protease family protein [Candidatus Gracilibacteria bacterium]
MIDFLIFIVAILVTLSVHEAAHAATAYYLGDPTAKLEGRVTLNPLKHLDFMGSMVFLITQRIGWGKPVPVNPANFKYPVRDSALTALAGPLSNFVFAFALAFFLKFTSFGLPFEVSRFLWTLFDLNLFLGIFNLFPFPPLDGSKIIGVFVPKRFWRQYNNYLENGVKYFVVILLVDAFILGDLFGFSFFGYVMRFLYQNLKMLMLLGTGCSGV